MTWVDQRSLVRADSFWSVLKFPEPRQRDELHLAFVGSHLRLAGERNLAHLALLVANFELAKGRQLQSEAVSVDVFSDLAHGRIEDCNDNIVRFAIRAKVRAARTRGAIVSRPTCGPFARFVANDILVTA